MTPTLTGTAPQSQSTRAGWPPAIWWLLALVLGIGWIAPIGISPLWDVDEGAFAESSRHLLTSNDWGHTQLNGADRFDKPILIYWLQAASLALFGISEWAVRLPSAVCSLILGLAVWRFAAPRFSSGAASWAVGTLVTCVGPALIGRAATADACLNLFVGLSLLNLWRGFEQPDARLHAWRRAGLYIGLGLLTKGPIAALIPAAVCAIHVWVGRRTTADTRPDARVDTGSMVRSFGSVATWATVVAAPWYGYALWRHGWAFVDGFLVQHNLQRFTGPLEGHGGSVAYFLIAFPLLMLPWTPALLMAAAEAWRRRATLPGTLEGYLWVWLALVIAFFSLSGTKLPHYALYAQVPAALLLARYLSVAPNGVRLGTLAVVAACALMLFGGALFSHHIAGWLSGEVTHSMWRAQLQQAAAQTPIWTLPGLIGLGLIPVVCFVLSQSRLLQGWAVWAVVVAAQLAQTLHLVPLWSGVIQGPVKALAEKTRREGLPLVQWGVHQPSAGFYRQEPAPRRPPERGEAALTTQDRLDSLVDGSNSLETLASGGVFVLVVRR